MTFRATVGGDDALRLFLALRLDEDDRARLAAWGAAALRDALGHEPGTARSAHDADGHPCRAVPASQLHVTLAFLGRRPRSDVDGAAAVLRAAADGAGPIALRPVRWRTTRSVGMLVLDDEGGRAAALAGRVHDGLEALGIYRRERRPWLPHVTLWRFRAGPLRRPFDPVPGGKASSPPERTCVPSDAAAYVSHLHPDGARYEVLQTVPITGRTDGQATDVNRNETTNGMNAYDDRPGGKEQA